MSNDTDNVQASLAAAKQRLQEAINALPELNSLVAQRQTRWDALVAIRAAGAIVGGDEMRRHNEEFGAAKNLLRHAKDAVTAKQAEIRALEQQVIRLEVLAGGDQALEVAKQRWRTASAAQVAAAKLAEAARDNLTRLDEALREEERKSAEAQGAQRAAILADRGFSDKPAGKVSAAASALIGSAAVIDALRSARPELEAKVAEADAKVAACAQDTLLAQQAILNAKQAIAEHAALEALATCRAAVQSLHVANMAATGHPGERHTLYGADDSPERLEQLAQRSRLRAMAGE